LRRGIFLISLSTVMIVGLSYGLWKLNQSRVGPIGNGTYHISTYIPFYIGIVSGLIGLFMGIMHIAKHKEWRKYHEKHLTKSQLQARYIPLMIILGVVFLFMIVFVAYTYGQMNSANQHSIGPWIGLIGFGAINLYVIIRYFYFIHRLDDNGKGE